MPPNLNQILANPRSRPETQLGKTFAEGAYEAPSHSDRGTSPSSSRLNIDLSRPLVQVKDESELDTESEVSSEEEDLRTYEPKPSLPKPWVEHRALNDLMAMVENGAVELYPDYQRDVVWDRLRMMALIDSIIENFYIAPLIFNRKITRDQSGVAHIKRVCVDGKQRLSSVRSFFQGKIGCHDRQGRVWYYTATAVDGTRTRRRTLPEHVKEEFRSRRFICYEYPNLKNTQEEDLFSRVQKGVQLTTAEKTRATTGPWQTFARLYEHDFPRVVEMSTTKRSAGFQNILISFGQMIEVQKCIAIDVMPKMKTPGTIMKALLKSRDDHNPHFRETIRQTYVKFNELVHLDPQAFQDNGYTHARNFSPFEFVATAVLVSLLKERQDNEALLESIRGMRSFLRRRLKDVRMNKDSWTVAWDYIKSRNHVPQQPMQVPDGRATTPLVPQPVDSVLAARLSSLDKSIQAGTRSTRPSLPQPSPETAGQSTVISDSFPILTAQLRGNYGPMSNFSSQSQQYSLNGVTPQPRTTDPWLQKPDDHSRNSLATPSFKQSSRLPPPQVPESGPDNRTKPLRAQLEQEATPARKAEAKTTTNQNTVNGIRKNRLARFTTSGANTQVNSKELFGAFPSASNTAAALNFARKRSGQKPSQAASAPMVGRDIAVTCERDASTKQPLRPKKRLSESIIEISDDESEAAEELLAKFKPHDSKRTKVKMEKTDEP
ncbi:protein of unknown function DUF262 [Macrophomina phaseolina MS6]|uniref:GmrSD restriction endonucleases N-terminal domain-containing protein n=1 Tax=Macrophomina phaseolina (strain MS6) TaxID=1126212 RepID=K2S6N4_MACPH|nr:protein of unknown function DUF262 [Macrophomina phaseolina MS6]